MALCRIVGDRHWMDGVIKDPNLAPNHSFRHYLKSQLLDRDTLFGHGRSMPR
jgi:hypothetical protein